MAVIRLAVRLCRVCLFTVRLPGSLCLAPVACLLLLNRILSVLRGHPVICDTGNAVSKSDRQTKIERERGRVGGAERYIQMKDYVGRLSASPLENIDYHRKNSFRPVGFLCLFQYSIWN